MIDVELLLLLLILLAIGLKFIIDGFFVEVLNKRLEDIERKIRDEAKK